MKKTKKEIDCHQERILKLLKRAWKNLPGEGLLELLGSCFAAGDISHISDEELGENLEALIHLEQKRRRERRGW